jgi:uncharacterized phage protein (TIGR01671 family)
MSRELKFRAWTGKEMRYNVSIDGYGGKVPSTYSSYEWPVMQYTGLKDKNGKEIYEGDIYEYEGWHGGVEFLIMEKERKEKGLPSPDYTERRVILGHPLGHYISRKIDDVKDMTYVGDTLNHSMSTATTWTVIGNIYQNPELLQA